MNSVGIHSKVLFPLVTGAIVGIVVTSYGYITNDANLQTVGWSILATTGGSAGIGYRAKPSATSDQEPSDSEALQQKIIKNS